MLVPIWFLIVAFAAEIFTAVIGFGSSTILTPLAVLFIDVKTALALVAIFHLAGAVVRLAQYKPAIDTEFAVQYGFPAMLAAFIGSLLVSGIPSQKLVMYLGLILLILVVYEFFHPKFRLPKTLTLETVTGLLTGFLGGLFGVGGAVRTASLQAFGLKKEEYIGTSALLAVIVDITRVCVYILSGYLAGVSFGWILLLIVIAVVGSKIGLRVAKVLPTDIFRLVVLASVFLVAVKLVIDGAR